MNTTISEYRGNTVRHNLVSNAENPPMDQLLFILAHMDLAARKKGDGS